MIDSTAAVQQLLVGTRKGTVITQFASYQLKVFAMIDELQSLGSTQRQAMALFLKVLIDRYAYEGIPGSRQSGQADHQ